MHGPREATTEIAERTRRLADLAVEVLLCQDRLSFRRDKCMSIYLEDAILCVERHVEEVVRLDVAHLFRVGEALWNKVCSKWNVIGEEDFAGGMLRSVWILGCKEHATALYASEIGRLEIVHKNDVVTKKLLFRIVWND